MRWSAHIKSCSACFGPFHQRLLGHTYCPLKIVIGLEAGNKGWVKAGRRPGSVLVMGVVGLKSLGHRCERICS